MGWVFLSSYLRIWQGNHDLGFLDPPIRHGAAGPRYGAFGMVLEAR